MESFLNRSSKDVHGRDSYIDAKKNDDIEQLKKYEAYRQACAKMCLSCPYYSECDEVVSPNETGRHITQYEKQQTKLAEEGIGNPAGYFVNLSDGIASSDD